MSDVVKMAEAIASARAASTTMAILMAELSSERRLFGTDGIRGVANQHPMTAEMALALGRSVAEHFRQRGKRCRIVIGKDTRLSGYMFESALEAGIVSAGADVMLVGPLPTPAIAFITSSMRADAGVVISASHNPFQDNGIKIFGPDGFKLADDIELEIERRIVNPEPLTPGPEPRIGKAVRLDDAEGRYVQFIKHTFPKDRTLDGLRIVVDCANGAAYRGRAAGVRGAWRRGQRPVGRARRAQHQRRLRGSPSRKGGRRSQADQGGHWHRSRRRRRPRDPDRRARRDRRRRCILAILGTRLIAQGSCRATPWWRR
jgi:hypothetical protein